VKPKNNTAEKSKNQQKSGDFGRNITRDGGDWTI
jgi:hypothetical protein